MADNQEQYGFFQIPHVGLNEENAPTVGNPVQTRDLNMRMSNFGALWTGNRLSIDYTRVDTMAFADKGIMEGAAEFGLHDLVQDAEEIKNPLVWGSTVKYTWNDEMFKMGMDTDDSVLRAGGSKSKSYPVALPEFDVMDTNLAQPDNMAAQRNYPTEGWRSFGGKYDFLPYSGGGFSH